MSIQRQQNSASLPRFVPKPLAGQATLHNPDSAGPGPKGASGTGWLSVLAPADIALPAYLVVAIVLGGGGSPSPLPEMVLEWMALALLAGLVLLKSGDRAWPRWAIGFALALIALPAVQLIPLPPAVWQALPGREIEAAALDLVGAGQKWMPWTLSPPRTLASLLALIVPAVALVAAALASPRGRTFALVTIVAMALVSTVIGMGQLAGGPHSALRFYAFSHREDLIGFQANRNAQADVLLAGLLALAALAFGHPARLRHGGAIAGAAAALLLAGALVLTSSRAGIALLVLATLAAMLALGRSLRTRASGRAWLVIGTGALVTVASLAWAVATNPVLARIGGRFKFGSETRPDIWQDTLFAIAQTWPWGSGIGTFGPVFVAAERLEAVNLSLPNRAHDDFLELALEAGAPGVVMLVVLVGLLAWRGVIGWRSDPAPRHRASLYFAAAVLAMLGLHSIVDYPLRSMALAALGGIAGGFILAPARHRGDAIRSGRVETKQP